ncbi:DUF2256 domain-containing protein [Rhodopirellula bahusiensis]|uniref:DUF2256 domain-containing protein n=1 Tax=Rhodopirellula bahusiensis TaxID=2014065 RepID=A0A2G1WAU7_9BACT|nr:hypothetical protein CEE69_05575 [Rhodopirellula bahusiensis]
MSAHRDAKRNLPTKICPVCRREFAWRKKWARDWGKVRYCSNACRKKASTPRTNP